MSFTSWLRYLRTVSARGWAERTRRRSLSARAAPSFRPRLEALEDRNLLSGVSFSAPVPYAVGQGPFSVAVGDFNGDGKPDMAVVNVFSNSVSVLLGNGDGTFHMAKNFAVGDQPSSLAVGDFNGDGKLDLVVANEHSNNVSVLLGNGDGTFQPAQNFFAGASSSVTVGDFNGDGKLDLAVAIGSSVSVLLGSGDGTFQTARNFAAGIGPISVTVGDFNGDGKPDLAVANFNSNNVSVLLGNGDGTFQTARNFAAGIDPISVTVGDFNGDSKPDLAVANFNNVSVLLGNGDGTFQAAKNFGAGADPRWVAVGDFNGDGKPDLAVANPNSGTFSVFLGNGDGTFQTAQNFGGHSSTVAVGDFNGDGKPDLALANFTGNTVDVLLNQVATTTAVSGPASSTYGQLVTYTATVISGGGPVTAGAVTFLDGNTPISPALPLDASGQGAFSIATLNAGSHTITASYSGRPGGAGITPIGLSAATTSLVVNPLPLSATAVNFSAIAGAPFSGTVATFTNVDPFGSAASYTAIITWGDGSTSAGAITGVGTLIVSGSHTYADPASYAASVQISHNLGDTTTATVFPTATVSNLGQNVQDGLTGGIGLWHNKNGQRLIDSFNGGPGATALSNWLAANFSNLYGAGAGANDLTGFSNYQVAAFYQSQFALSGSNLEAEVLATALNVYATTQSLGGTIGQTYGFTVTATGLGADSFNVGADGAAFGVANNTTLNVYELLKAVNRQAVNGLLYNGDAALRNEADDLFAALNQAGAIL
jgi:Bacterial Ig-like domain (group 3)/FG-GAP-like repeat/FG-GAP repeat